LKVALSRAREPFYASRPPFNPSSVHAEIVAAGFPSAAEPNHGYDAVRASLHALGLDRARFGSADWNPLREMAPEGSSIVIKPNLVMHDYGSQLDANCLTTHGSIIRAVLDYAFLAVGRNGKITIADAPVQGADFDLLCIQKGLNTLQEFYRETFDFALQVVDLRQSRAIIDEKSGLIVSTEILAGDPAGYEVIDLRDRSRLKEIDGPLTRYVVGDYNDEVTNVRHGNERHEYVVSRTVLSADCIVSVPKLKTHSKVGITAALKNAIGTIGSKDCLPHHRHGVPSSGGDEFPESYSRAWLVAARAHQFLQGRVPQWIWRTLRFAAGTLLQAGTKSAPAATSKGRRARFFTSGGWSGNDTIWRTVEDLNRILLFWNHKTETLEPTRQRNILYLVDGIVSMEGNGPLKGSPKQTGVVLAGRDPLAVDIAGAALLGFDWRRIPMLAGITDSRSKPAFAEFTGDPTTLQIVSTTEPPQGLSWLENHATAHLPPAGWVGAVESTEAGQ